MNEAKYWNHNVEGDAVECPVGSMCQGSLNVLIYQRLHRILTLSSIPNMFSVNMKSFLAFSVLFSNRLT